jgi:hypothetical protein
MVAIACAAAVIGTAAVGDAGAQARKVKAKKKQAAPKAFKVRIETQPAGASVYLGDKESPPAGETPLDLALPAGDHVVILELDGHLARFETVSIEAVGAAAPAQTFAFELDPATATLVIEVEDGEPIPAGTRVMIDGVDRGPPPVRVEVEVGPHLVEVAVPDGAGYEEWVEVEGGQEHLMAITAARLGVDAVAPAPPRTSAPPRGALGTARTGVEIGWRRFRYDAPRTANLLPYTAAGSIHFTIDAELHPWRRFVTSRLLDRVAITAGAGYSPPIEARDTRGVVIDAYWRSQHAGARLRGIRTRRLAVDVDAGWVHTLYTFRDDAMRLVDQVPDVDYHMLRLGARVVARRGPDDPYEAWLGADNRVVLSAGALERRFRGADVDGVAARAGAAAWLFDRHLEARVEAALTRLGWRFASERGDAYDADGGSDLLVGVTITVGGRY